MRFERTMDYELIRQIITHPEVYPWVTDDSAKSVDEFQPLENENMWYVLAWDEDDLLGMWVLTPWNGICAEVHTCLLPGHGFRRGRLAAREFADWVWDNTPFRRVVTNVPSYNRLALRFAEDSGMIPFGVNEGSIMKSGRLYDQTLLGMSKPKER